MKINVHRPHSLHIFFSNEDPWSIQHLPILSPHRWLDVSLSKPRLVPSWCPRGRPDIHRDDFWGTPCRHQRPRPEALDQSDCTGGMNYWVNYTWFLIFFLLNTDDFSDLRAILRIIYMLWGLEWIWSQWAKCEAQNIERNKMDYSNTGLQQFRLKHSNIWIIDMGIAAVGCFVRCSSAKNHQVLMLGCTTTVGGSRGRIVF